MADRAMSSAQSFEDYSSGVGLDAGFDDPNAYFVDTNILNLEDNPDDFQSATDGANLLRSSGSTLKNQDSRIDHDVDAGGDKMNEVDPNNLDESDVSNESFL